MISSSSSRLRFSPVSYTHLDVYKRQAEDGAAENGAAGKIPGDVSPDSAGPKRLSRMFPIHGGILQTMARQPGYRYVSVDGLRNSMAAIDDVINGRLPGCFIEMSACNGSCVGGPSFQRRELSALARCV